MGVSGPLGLSLQRRLPGHSGECVVSICRMRRLRRGVPGARLDGVAVLCPALCDSLSGSVSEDGSEASLQGGSQHSRRCWQTQEPTPGCLLPALVEDPGVRGSPPASWACLPPASTPLKGLWGSYSSTHLSSVSPPTPRMCGRCAGPLLLPLPLALAGVSIPALSVDTWPQLLPDRLSFLKGTQRPAPAGSALCPGEGRTWASCPE